MALRSAFVSELNAVASAKRRPLAGTGSTLLQPISLEVGYVVLTQSDSPAAEGEVGE